MIIFLFFFYLNVCAEVIQTSSSLPISYELNKANSSTLVIIDLFDVLICFEDEILNSNNKKSLQKYLKQFEEEKLFKEEKIKKIFENRKLKLVDKFWIDELKKIEYKEVFLLGYAFNSQYNIISFLENNNLMFSNKKLHFDSNRHFKFDKGVLIFKGSNFKTIEMQFNSLIKNKGIQKIIVISSNRNFIQWHEEIAKKNKILFVGLEYTFVKNLPALSNLAVKEKLLLLFNEKSQEKNARN